MKIFKSYLIEPQCYNPQSEIELSKPFRLLIPDSATLKNLSMALLGFVSPFPATGILLMEIAHEFSWLCYYRLIPMSAGKDGKFFGTQNSIKKMSFPVPHNLIELVYCAWKFNAKEIRE